MEETTQEQPESNLSSPKIEENIDNKKPEIEKSDSVETEVPIPEQTEDIIDDVSSEIENDKSDDGNGDCSDHSGDETDDASVVLEREEGDGQESTPNRKVDDDEDKRNPQYIPKRGTFYEHDDRTAVDEEGEEGEKPENERKEETSKKKVWSEKEGSKWSHDRFNDQEQAPKSRTELVAIYGYDIRNEEGPPRARRRRRYGRGPNKYTRNWEDEEAYSKPTNVQVKPPPRKPRRAKNGEEFPALGGSGSGGGSGGGSISDAKSPEPSDPTVEEDTLENDNTPPPKPDNIPSADFKPLQQENGPLSPRHAHTAGKPQRGGMRNAPRREEPSKIPPANNNMRGVTKTRGFQFKNGVRAPDASRVRNHKIQQKQEEEYSDYIVSQNFTNKAHSPAQQQQQQQGVQKLEKDMANMSMQHQEFSGGSGGSGNNRGGGKFGGGNPRQTSVPPRLQGEQRGSKRYSSLRQRSLPETASNPQFGQHPQFYQGAEFPPEFSGQPGGGQTGGGAGLLPHPPTSGTSVPLNGATHVMQGPPFAQPYPPAPPAAFLQPVQPPVQSFLPQQPPPPPQIINFAQPPPQPYPPPTFPNFQHQQFNPVNQAQPTELYQPQGGITYYSPQNQQMLPRVPQKRVKAAIPIVPPPEHKEPRGRGRLSQGEGDSPIGGPPEPLAEEQYSHENTSTAANAPVVVQH